MPRLDDESYTYCWIELVTIDTDKFLKLGNDENFGCGNKLIKFLDLGLNLLFLHIRIKQVGIRITTISE